MKVVLARSYRMWMLVLFPATAGLGTVALWLRSMNWPLRIDEQGVVLRHHGRVNWHSVTKLGLSRSYVDGRCSQIRIHYGWGTSKVPVDALEDGQAVVRAIVTFFEQAHCSGLRPDSVHKMTGAVGPRALCSPSRSVCASTLNRGSTGTRSREFGMLGDVLQQAWKASKFGITRTHMTTALLGDAPKNDSGRTSSANSRTGRRPGWLALTAIAFGAVLTFLWTASLLGLSVWALLLLV